MPDATMTTSDHILLEFYSEQLPFSFRINAVRIFQIEYEAHPTSYTTDTAVVFLRIKQPKLEADHLSPFVRW
jgi:hypothetical protein